MQDRNYDSSALSDLDFDFTLLEETPAADDAKKGQKKSTFLSSAQAILGLGNSKTPGNTKKAQPLPDKNKLDKIMKSPPVRTRHLQFPLSGSQMSPMDIAQPQKRIQSQESSFLARTAAANLRLQQLAGDNKQTPINAAPISTQQPAIEVGKGSLDLSRLGHTQRRHNPSSGVPSRQNSESKPLLRSKKPFDFFIELSSIVSKTKQYIQDTNFAGDEFQLHDLVSDEFNKLANGRNTALTTDEIDSILTKAMENYSAQQTLQNLDKTSTRKP